MCAPRRADAPTSFAGRALHDAQLLSRPSIAPMQAEWGFKPSVSGIIWIGPADKFTRSHLRAPTNEMATASGGLRDASLKNPFTLTRGYVCAYSTEVAFCKQKSARRAGSDLWPNVSGGRFSVLADTYTATAERMAAYKRRDG